MSRGRAAGDGGKLLLGLYWATSATLALVFGAIIWGAIAGLRPFSR